MTYQEQYALGDDAGKISGHEELAGFRERLSRFVPIQLLGAKSQTSKMTNR
jgi:hypothetical protein